MSEPRLQSSSTAPGRRRPRHKAVSSAAGLCIVLLAAPLSAAFAPAASGDALAPCALLDASAPAFSADPPAFADAYTRDTVTGPVENGLSLYVPDLPDQPLIRCGYVDVTREPFSADPSGAADSTHALNAALEFARRHMLVTFVPFGTYRVTDTIECAQGRYRQANGAIGGDRNGPCVLIGSRSRGSRPKIVLAPTAPGFDDPHTPRSVIHFWARSKEDPHLAQSNISFNQMIVNIEVEIGEGNAGAIGIRHRGAQGSSIQDVRIDARHGFAGIEGGAGSGGSHINIEVIGGRFGFDLSQTQTTPTITAATLIGQTGSAIRFENRNTLTVVGTTIAVPDGAEGPAIRALIPDWAPLSQLNLIDSRIVFASPRPDAVAVTTNRTLYLKNVFVRHAGTIASLPDGRALAGTLTGNGWRHVVESVHPVRPPLFREGEQTFQYEMATFLDGADLGYHDVEILGRDGTEPPADLRSRHVWEASFPSAETPGAVNAKAAPYHAVGDGVHDDTDAIQAAIDANEVVFLPKGYYRIARPLTLRSDSRLVGVARHLSVLIAADGPAFGDAADPKPLVQTANDADADTVLAFLGLFVREELAGNYALSWQAGRRSMVRAVNVFRFRTKGKARVLDVPLVLISGEGGGRWYNFFQERGGRVDPGYRHLLIDGTREPLSLYGVNPEHARGEANMEIRNARRVTVYSLKSQGNYPVLWVRDSDHIEVFGFGGNAAAFEADHEFPADFEPFTPSLLRFERTPNFRIANAVDGSRVSGGSDDEVGGRGIDPNLWHHMLEIDASGTAVLTPPLVRLALYVRGNAFGNIPPLVAAGGEKTITLPETASLMGQVSDDGNPDPPKRVTVVWRQVSGPGDVTFADAASVATEAAFSAPGVYVLRLTADDGAASASDDLIVTVQPEPDLAPDVAHWTFDGTAADSSANANHGRLRGSPSWVKGAIGGAVHLDGAFVAIDALNDDADGREGSTAIWIKRSFGDATPSDKTVFRLRAGPGNLIKFHYAAAGHRWQLRYRAGGLTTVLDVPGAAIPRGVWTHVAVTWSDAGDEVAVYLDGLLQRKGRGIGSWNAPLDRSALGSDGSAATVWKGAIDDVRVYGHPLSPTAVSRLHALAASNR